MVYNGLDFPEMLAVFLELRLHVCGEYKEMEVMLC